MSEYRKATEETRAALLTVLALSEPQMVLQVREGMKADYFAVRLVPDAHPAANPREIDGHPVYYETIVTPEMLELHKALLNLLERRNKPDKDASRKLREFSAGPCDATAMVYGEAKDNLDIVDREIAILNDRRGALGIIKRV